MNTLFLQLGLPADDASIAEFIRANQLALSIHIADAPVWNEAQRQFIGEQLNADARWTVVIDQLNEALHKDAALTS